MGAFLFGEKPENYVADSGWGPGGNQGGPARVPALGAEARSERPVTEYNPKHRPEAYATCWG